MPAEAQVFIQLFCGDYGKIVTNLNAKYDEWGVWLGKREDGSGVQLFANPHRDSFTILTRETDGSACILTAGNEWMSRDFPIATSE